MEREQRDRTNPDNMLVRFMLICSKGHYNPDQPRPKILAISNDSDNYYKDALDWQDLRRLYAIHVDRNSSCMTFKQRICLEF
jgi:hypothetical protein